MLFSGFSGLYLFVVFREKIFRLKKAWLINCVTGRFSQLFKFSVVAIFHSALTADNGRITKNHGKYTVIVFWSEI